MEEKIIKIQKPFDKRNKDPAKNYGIGALRIFFIFKKDNKAVQVLLSTNCYLASTNKEYKLKWVDWLSEFADYEGWSCHDVGYHSPYPMFENQDKMECDLLEHGECYYDGSSLRGKSLELAKLFLTEGEEPIWKFLKEEWNRTFKDVELNE